jgi:hypothetical protein
MPHLALVPLVSFATLALLLQAHSDAVRTVTTNIFFGIVYGIGFENGLGNQFVLENQTACGLAPKGVAIDGEGNGWVGDTAVPAAYRLAAGAPDGLVVTLPFIPAASALLADGGAVFVGGGPQADAGRAARLDASGTLLWDRLTASGPSAVVATRDAGIVILHKTFVSETRLSRLEIDGTPGGSVGFPELPAEMSMDEEGKILIAFTQAGQVRRYSTLLVLEDLYVVGPGAFGVATDGAGGCYVTFPSESALRRIHASGVTMGEITVAGGPQSVAREGGGSLLVAAMLTGILHRFTFDGYPMAMLPLFTGLSGFGDMTGFGYAAGAGAADDSDADGFVNAMEVLAGSNPYDGASLPVSLSLLATPAPGSSVQVLLRSPLDPFRVYVSSLSHEQAEPWAGPNGPFPLAPTSFFFHCLFGPDSILSPSFGLLDGDGAAVLSLDVPPIQVLSGMIFFGAFVVADPGQGWSILRASRATRIEVP